MSRGEVALWVFLVGLLVTLAGHQLNLYLM